MFVLLVFVVLIIIYTLDPPSNLLSLTDNPDRADGIRAGGCFIGGALLSAAAGWAGMSVATDANVRTTQAADKQGLSVALRVAFTGGAVMGFTVVGLGLAGLSFFFWLMTLNRYVLVCNLFTNFTLCTGLTLLWLDLLRIDQFCWCGWFR